MVFEEVAVGVSSAGEGGGREELGYAVCLVCELVLCDFSGVFWKEIFDMVEGCLLFLMCFNRKLAYSSMPTNF